MEHSSHYMRVIPNSQSFESLNNIIVHYELTPEEISKEYLLLAFKNTRERNIDIQKIDTTKENLPIIFKSIDDVIHLITYDPHFSLHMFVSIIKSTIESGYDLKETKQIKIKMKKKKVYSRVDGELDYQQLKWVPRREANGIPDESKPPAEWINYIECHLARAKQCVYELDDEGAMDEIRKVTALGVRSMMIHGCPERIIPLDLLEQREPSGA